MLDVSKLPLSLLKVYIHKAKDIKNVELISVSDAFVLAKCGENGPSLMTDIVPNSLDPWWH